MKTLSYLSLQLCVVVILGIVTGALLARSHSMSPGLSQAGKDASLTVSGNGGPVAGSGIGNPLVHTAFELDDWVRQASELAMASGIGFHGETDAPHLLLALKHLTPADFPLLMERVFRLPDNGAKAHLQAWLLTEWSRLAPEDALAWTKENLPDRYQEAIRALARKNPRAAWDEIKANPINKNGSGEPTVTIFAQWGMQDGPAALEAMLQMVRDGKDPTAANLGFFSTALPDRKKSPEQWSNARDNISKRILEEKEAKVRISALSALMMEISNTIPASGGNRSALETKRRELSEWLFQIPLAETDQARLLTCIAQWDGSRADGAADAFAWLWQTVPVGQRVEALTSIVEYWASDKPWSSKDPDGCGRWLNEQGPLGPEFSGALKSFALHAVAKDPESGLAWAQQIADPAIRQDAVQEVKAQILKQWPHRAAGLGVGP